MNIEISNVIRISNLTPSQEKIITSGLSLKNPVYDVMLRQNNQRALYAVKKFFKYYDKIENGLSVGRGVIPRINRHFKDDVNSVRIDLVKPVIKANKFVCSATLRDYQNGVTDEILKNLEGVIRLDTAFGKSIIAMKLIEDTQLRTLIVVPRLNLLRQFKEDIKKFCNYECGIINGPTFDIKDVTVATIQTLKKRDLSNIRDKFGMCIWDECHLTISVKGIKAVQSFNPLRLYGMTATADRSDGQGEAIMFTFGDIIIDRKLPAEKPCVSIIKCDEATWGDTYATIIDSQVENINRNKLIASVAIEESQYNRKILILTKRTKHYENLYKILPGHLRSYQIKSQLKAIEQRRQDSFLNDLRDGGKEFDIILGTFGLLSTGINIPALDTIIFAGDLKSSVLATQSVGRILRLFEGKQTPKIIDIDDCKSGILHNQARLRKRFYKDNEWEII